MKISPEVEKWNAKWVDEAAGATPLDETMLLLKPYVKFGRNTTILDVGCGDGRYVRKFAKRAKKACGCDVSHVAISKANKTCRGLKNVELKRNAGCHLRIYKDGMFDFVFCIALFQHLKRDTVESYMGEFLRVLNNHGELVAQFPDSWRREEIGELVNGCYLALDSTYGLVFNIIALHKHHYNEKVDWFVVWARKMSRSEKHKGKRYNEECKWGAI